MSGICPRPSVPVYGAKFRGPGNYSRGRPKRLRVYNVTNWDIRCESDGGAAQEVLKRNV